MLPLVHLLEAVGLCAVGLCFIVLLPNTGVFLVALFSTILGEQAYARFRGVESGSEMHLDD